MNRKKTANEHKLYRMEDRDIEFPYLDHVILALLAIDIRTVYKVAVAYDTDQRKTVELGDRHESTVRTSPSGRTMKTSQVSYSRSINKKIY